MSERPSRPHLPDVTLVAVTSVALGPTLDALRASMEQADFARVLLLSDRRPPEEVRGVQWQPIAPLRSRTDYSRFMLRELADHIATSHALCIQWDGFVVNGAGWTDEFLHFDYIGAVWPHFRDSHNVGNGGFSLRSRRVLDACRDLPLDADRAEDLAICRLYRRHLEQRGIRFAPEALARRFAYERTPSMGQEFGFHGVFNLVEQLPPDDAARLFKSLEPNMLARSERWELLRWALRHRRIGLALNMLRRLV